MLANSKPDPNLGDGWEWSISRKGKFTIKSLYLAMINQGSTDFPHKGIWMSSIPLKVSFFIWNIVMNKILSIDHLQNRGWNLANRCVICMREEESVDHLLVHRFMA